MACRYATIKPGNALLFHLWHDPARTCPLFPFINLSYRDG
jgi:hypothetical protein